MKKREFEKREKIILEKYAVFSYKTIGRKYVEEEHFLRSPFQRDRDRIIHSTAFRRLEYKTQVFIYHEGDYYRNRLTHTLEVQQIARTIARELRVNEDLVEAISLAHDLGHTPFGHKGEAILDEIMKNYNLPGFEHNRQGLRIVDYLEERYPDFPGLNLTFEVREGIIRHTTSYDIPLIEKEYEEFTKFKSPTLECQIVNIADEIAYTCHDLDDGIKSEIIDYRDVREVEMWREIEKISEIEKKPERHRRHIMIRNLINYLVTDLIIETKKNLRKLNPQSVNDVRNLDIIVKNSEKVRTQHAELRKFLEENMYTHPKVIRMTEKGGRIIKELFEAYYKEPRQLPYHIQKRIEKEKKEIVICDYIAGMTDRFALSEYQKLFDPTTF
ncbi:MAG: deoxyguanosinetriphosphate triphosphohydrolase [bacterium]|nr:deoxyguanosinetriphosphate triphosphohydrolase [bacterium]MCX7916907.1 deoxyguanosinetriphosphate triphosphohydrolase [bacterium]MDW8163907.1 deoxyguanosinetriphosphate triphosphohydrolase [Candidatus Omnitrophota bacterium]